MKQIVSSTPHTVVNVRLDRDVYTAFQVLCHARSIEVGDAVRGMLQQLVAAGTLESLFTADEKGYMPGAPIAEMRRGINWTPKKKRRPRARRP